MTVLALFFTDGGPLECSRAQILTKDPGNAQWLASIQKSKGMRSGHHSASACPASAVKPKKSKKGRVDDDEEAQELETFVKPKGKKKKDKSRG